MSDFVAHPDGGMVEKGQEAAPAAAPQENGAAPAEEVKTDAPAAAEAAPEEEKPEEEAEKEPEGDEPASSDAEEPGEGSEE